MIQFEEHEKGMKSGNPKVRKLDKLAKMLGIAIKIDGIPYGAELTTEPVSNSGETPEPSPKRGRKKAKA